MRLRAQQNIDISVEIHHHLHSHFDGPIRRTHRRFDTLVKFHILRFSQRLVGSLSRDDIAVRLQVEKINYTRDLNHFCDVPLAPKYHQD